MINGSTLIAMGYQPGPWFKEAIDYVNNNQLTVEEMGKYLEKVSPAKIIEMVPHKTPIHYHMNIESKTEEEAYNILNVYETMDIVMKTPTVVGGCVMPDACPSGDVGQIPVGGVVVTKNAIHPAMHSADICCSVMLTNFGNVNPKIILDIANQITHFGFGGRKDAFDLPDDLKQEISKNPFTRSEKSIGFAQTHMGTQGDGNHFLFVGKNRKGETCMVTHHGSRGFGAELYKTGIKVAEKFRQKISPKTTPKNAWIPYDTQEGKDYWDALQIVRKWTKLNHFNLHYKVSKLSGRIMKECFWNEHNFVFKHEELFYHAKGATPLDDKFVPDSTDGLRIIPLNMGQPILIVKGCTTENNLGFAPHGAGRNISRTKHKKNITGTTDDEQFAIETKGLDIRFFSNNIDVSELPSAYKDANNIKSQMRKFNLGKIVDEIMPYGCIMAGDMQKDAPWRKKKEAKNG